MFVPQVTHVKGRPVNKSVRTLGFVRYNIYGFTTLERLKECLSIVSDAVLTMLLASFSIEG